MTKRSYTPEERWQILEKVEILLEEGLDSTRISMLLDVNQSTWRGWLKSKRNGTMENPQARRDPVPEKIRNKLNASVPRSADTALNAPLEDVVAKLNAVVTELDVLLDHERKLQLARATLRELRDDMMRVGGKV